MDILTEEEKKRQKKLKDLNTSNNTTDVNYPYIPQQAKDTWQDVKQIGKEIGSGLNPLNYGRSLNNLNRRATNTLLSGAKNVAENMLSPETISEVKRAWSDPTVGNGPTLKRIMTGRPAEGETETTPLLTSFLNNPSRDYAMSKVPEGSTLGHRSSAGKNDPGNYYSVAPNGSEGIIRSEQWDKDNAVGSPKNETALQQLNQPQLKKNSERIEIMNGTPGSTKNAINTRKVPDSLLRLLMKPQTNPSMYETVVGYKKGNAIYGSGAAALSAINQGITGYNNALVRGYTGSKEDWDDREGIMARNQASARASESQAGVNNFELNRLQALAQLQDAYSAATTPGEQAKAYRKLQAFGQANVKNKSNAKVIEVSDGLGGTVEEIWNDNGSGKYVRAMQEQPRRLSKDHPAIKYLRENPSQINKFREKYGYLPSQEELK